MGVVCIGEVACFLAGVGEIAVCIEPGKVSRRGGGYFVGLARVGVVCIGKIRRFLAGVGRIAARVEPGEISGDGRGGFRGLFAVQLFYIFLHGVLVCRRKITGDNVTRRPCAGGRAVLRSCYRERVPVLCGHEHRLRRGAVRSNREQIRSIR